IRYTHRDMPWWGFVLVDGACSNNGRLGAQGGWAVVYGPPTETGQPPQVVSGRLEEKGPFGCDFAPTSNRAELRASIAALRLCYWPHYGFKCLVIATDSSYVVEGATSWSKEWIRNGWRNAKGATVVNSDLWSLLLEEIRLWRSNGLRVLFWKIPRELNQEADSAAKAASLYGFREPQFIDWSMLPPPPSNPSTDMAPVRPLNRVLVICPQSKGLVDYRYSPLLSRIRHHAQVVELGQTTEEAVHLLRKRPAPDAILLTDGAICRDADIRWFVLAHIQASGSRVILTGDFGRSPDDDVDSVFDAFGVPWRRGGIIHQAVKNGDHLRREHPRLFSTMPTQHTQSGLSLLKVDVTESAYIPLHEEYSGESATAVRGVRDGFLCFVGDETPASEDIILAMC
ncbi:ribonuclease H-like domain-containing protein, partial [Podospora conica]